jgi:hypothetical protein
MVFNSIVVDLKKGWVTAFARAFIRAIPLNTLSALTPACNPWHDKWTRTTVIREDL